MVLLDIRELKVYYHSRIRGIVRAVDGVSLTLDRDESLGLVGESGSGKSTIAFALMRLLPNYAKISGKILFDGINLLEASEDFMRSIRGKRIALVPQDPFTSLDPLMRVGDQIAEAIIAHNPLMEKEDAKKLALEALEAVGIMKNRANDYPHQFSGGMRQRALIAMAIALKPDLLIADEPTTALDVIVQAQILDLLKDLKKKLGLSIILISHDISVIMQVSDKIAVMYAGKIVETAPSLTIAESPVHPYTKALIRSVPNIDTERQVFEAIPGQPPDLTNPPSGCRFHPRCPLAGNKCKTEEPPLVKIGEKHYVACWLYAKR